MHLWASASLVHYKILYRANNDAVYHEFFFIFFAFYYLTVYLMASLYNVWPLMWARISSYFTLASSCTSPCGPSSSPWRRPSPHQNIWQLIITIECKFRLKPCLPHLIATATAFLFHFSGFSVASSMNLATSSLGIMPDPSSTKQAPSAVRISWVFERYS